jgi:hypothetical protein
MIYIEREGWRVIPRDAGGQPHAEGSGGIQTMRRLISLLLVSGLLLGVAYAEEAEKGESKGFEHKDSRFKLRVRNWVVDVDGETSFIKNVRGGRIDLGSKLDLKDDFSPQVNLRWQFKPRHSFEVGYAHMESDADADVNETVVIDDVAIPVLGHLEGDTELHFLRFDWRRKLFLSDSGRFDVETILGLLAFDIDARYEAHLPGFGWVGNFPPWMRELYREWLGHVLPDELDFLNFATYWDDEFDLMAGTYLVGISGTWRPHRKWALTAQAMGSWAGTYGYLIDLEACAGYSPTDWFEIFAGYRYWETEVEDDDEEYVLIFEGVFAGMEFSF